jgi:uncharacterized protein YuzE
MLLGKCCNKIIEREGLESEREIEIERNGKIILIVYIEMLFCDDEDER